MKKTFLKLALVAMPALFATACGGDLFGPLDGGVDSGSGACPQGTTIYQVKDSVYPAVQGSATILSDTCNTGVMASQLETNRTVKNDGAGNITLYSSDGTTIQGSGPVRCNSSTLAFGPTSISDGACRFDATYSVDLKITANNAFTATITQNRTNTMKEAGMTCPQPVSCAVSYRVSQKL